MASSPANEVLKSLMPLKYRGLLHPLPGRGRVAKQPSRCGGLLADQYPIANALCVASLDRASSEASRA